MRESRSSDFRFRRLLHQWHAEGQRPGDWTRWEKKAANPPHPRMASPRSAQGAARVMNLSRAPPAEMRSASLPSEIVRPKPMQVVKFDRVVVTRRMQDHSVRRRACLFVADIGVAHEPSMVVDGSPPVRAVPNQFATGFTAPLDFWEAPLFRGQ